MPQYSTNEFRSGLKVMLDGAPCNILENELIKPGKGQAFNRVKLRNLKTGRIWERTFKSSESLEGADVVERKMVFTYQDGGNWHFMDSGSYEQHQADEAAVAEALPWLAEQSECDVVLWNDAPLTVSPPNFVELAIAETDPGLRGDTATGGSKSATLVTGAVVKVPLFVGQGEIVRVDTRTGEYQSRVK